MPGHADKNQETLNLLLILKFFQNSGIVILSTATATALVLPLTIPIHAFCLHPDVLLYLHGAVVDFFSLLAFQPFIEQSNDNLQNTRTIWQIQNPKHPSSLNIPDQERLLQYISLVPFLNQYGNPRRWNIPMNQRITTYFQKQWKSKRVKNINTNSELVMEIGGCQMKMHPLVCFLPFHLFSSSPHPSNLTIFSFLTSIFDYPQEGRLLFTLQILLCMVEMI